MSDLEDKLEKSMSFSARYELQAKIGAGGMGSVYKGYDRVLKKPIAIKVLLPNSQNDAVIRFHQEAKMAAKLSHANILNVFDFGQNEEGDLYLIMDFLDGEGLNDRLKRMGALPLPEALSIFLQICSGLQHAHSQGILHRDIKPSNIMIVTDERGLPLVKIVDFGLAKLKGSEQSLTTTGIRVGSPLYMSPEQAQTEKIDQRSDLYSLGCLMYKVLTGKTPFVGETLLVTLNKHANEVPPSINEVIGDRQYPQELADIVAKTLEKDPDDRYQSAQELAEAIMSLDLSFLILPSATVPVPDVVSEDTGPKKVKQRIADWPIYIKALGALFLMVCLFVGGIALFKFFDTGPAATKTVYWDEPDSVTDVFSDKLTCGFGKERGKLSAQSDFGDEDMDSLLRFRKQKQLSLSKCQVTGKNFSVLRKLPLEDLDLSFTRIDDAALEEVGKLRKLTRLNLNGNKIGDAGVKSLARLRNLEELNLGNTKITDLSLEALVHLPYLKTLNVDECENVSADGLTHLAKIESLKTLSAVRCPNISSDALKQFRATNKFCEVIAEEETKPTVADETEAQKKKLRLRKKFTTQCLQCFLKYKDDMQDPVFRKFFMNSNAWKISDYSKVQNPKILRCLKDKELRAYMKDKDLQDKWNESKTWINLDEAEGRLRAVFLQND